MNDGGRPRERPLIQSAGTVLVREDEQLDLIADAALEREGFEGWDIFADQEQAA